jgi:hypothetical protein
MLDVLALKPKDEYMSKKTKEVKNDGRTYFENPVYDEQGNVIRFQEPGEPIAEGESLSDEKADELFPDGADEVSRAEKSSDSPAVKAKKEKKVKAPKVKNESLTVKVAKPPKVPGERKIRTSVRSILLAGKSHDEKRDLVVNSLKEKFGDFNFIDEGEHLFAEISVNSIPVFLKYKRIEKGNPMRSLMVSAYPSDFRGKKVKPIGRRYEKKGRIFINRLFDMVDTYIQKKSAV